MSKLVVEPITYVQQEDDYLFIDDTAAFNRAYVKHIFPFMSWCTYYSQHPEYEIFLLGGNSDYPLQIARDNPHKSPHTILIHKNLIVNPLNLKLDDYRKAAMLILEDIRRLHANNPA